jgi:Domain of unknown function (DUF4268)
MKKELGQIKRVKVTNVWAHEAHEFTPWLAQPENVAQLANAIGLELEVEGIEVSVGPYSADILAKDTYSGRFVVIENQFGKTNHDHLGKLLTYGATLGASAVVWLAETFTEEHRKAIEWLNDNTTEELSLYAVEIELWQVDDSKPAVRFNTVSRPNELLKQATSAKLAGDLTESQRLQLDFWTLYKQQLLAKKVVASTRTPMAQYWFDVPLGRTSIFLSCIANTTEGRIGVRVYLGGRVSDPALAQLTPQRGKIEAEIGSSLDWNPYPDKRDKTIGLFKKVDLDDRSKWPEYVDWLVDKTAKFRAAFMPRVKVLDLHQANLNESANPRYDPANSGTAPE